MSKALGFLGGFSVVTGVLFALNSIGGITGFTVSGKVYAPFLSFFGLFFIILGVFILYFNEEFKKHTIEVKAMLK